MIRTRVLGLKLTDFLVVAERCCADLFTLCCLEWSMKQDVSFVKSSDAMFLLGAMGLLVDRHIVLVLGTIDVLYSNKL